MAGIWGGDMWKRWLAIAGLGVLILLVGGAPPALADAPKQGGIAYTTYWSGNYGRPGADVALANLADTGAGWISLLVTEYQQTIDDTTIQPTPATATHQDLIHAIEQARRLGLKIMLKPHVDPLDGNWRGEIGAQFDGQQWRDWFDAYADFLLPYAQLAQDYRLEQFCVGVEYVEASKRDADWRDVLAQVRAVYSGSLVYAANHSGEEARITWWDELDYIGVDAYYPLSDDDHPDVNDLVQAWGTYTPTLRYLHDTWGKPIILSEIGYRSINRAPFSPWDWQREGDIDLEVQADAYEAVFRALWHETWLAGIYWWEWGADPFEGGPYDKGYTVFDKPAEEVLRRWYGAPPKVEPLRPGIGSRALQVIYGEGFGSGWLDASWGCDWAEVASPVYSGTRALYVDLERWGALSLDYPGLDLSPYYWLTFQVRAGTPDGHLWVFFADDQGRELTKARADYWRHVQEGELCVGHWREVRIPLSSLGAQGRTIGRIIIQNRSDGPATLWFDEFYLVNASWSLRLPMIWR